MWSPADQSALPTLEDLEKARESINLVQIDLDIAIQQLAQAQTRVDTLWRDLKERKAWVALVRRLPFDVLSTIFTWCACVNAKSPVRIAAVCRAWRQVILETPLAWSFIDLDPEIPEEGINMFFERSRQHPLHIYFPKSRSFELLSSVAHRICCLTLQSISSLPPNSVFPHVRRLSIPYHRRGIPISSINTRQFPALIHLWTKNAPLCSAGPLLEGSFVFPPLKSWKLHISPDSSWCAGLNVCRSTLVSLALHDHMNGRLVVQQRILLPALKYLEVLTNGNLRRELLDLKTPILETYTEFVFGSNLMERPIHTDISTAWDLRFNDTPSLSYCTGVQKLQLYHSTPNKILALLQQLRMDSGISPALQIIEPLASDDWGNVVPLVDALSEMNRSRVRPIRLIMSGDESPLAGLVPGSCQDGTPCLDYW